MSFPQAPKSKSAEVLFSTLGVEVLDTRSEEKQTLGETSGERGAHTGIEKSAPRASHKEEPVEASAERVRFATKSRTGKSPTHSSQGGFSESSEEAAPEAEDASLDFAAKRVQTELSQAQAQAMPSQLSAFRAASDESAAPLDASVTAQPAESAEAAETSASSAAAAAAADVTVDATAEADASAAAAVAAPAPARPESEVKLAPSGRSSRNLDVGVPAEESSRNRVLMIVGIVVLLLVVSFFVWRMLTMRKSPFTSLGGGDAVDVPAAEFTAPAELSEFIEFM